MKHVVEELERLNEALSATDPGDLDRLAGLLRERAQWIDELGAIAAAGYDEADAAQMLNRLRAVAAGMATPYRALTLHRILMQQRLGELRQRRSVLRAFAPEGRENRTGALVTTAL